MFLCKWNGCLYLLSFWQFELILRPLGGSRNSVICACFLKSHQKSRIWPVVQSEASLLNPNSSHIMSDKKATVLKGFGPRKRALAAALGVSTDSLLSLLADSLQTVLIFQRVNKVWRHPSSAWQHWGAESRLLIEVMEWENSNLESL